MNKKFFKRKVVLLSCFLIFSIAGICLASISSDHISNPHGKVGSFMAMIQTRSDMVANIVEKTSIMPVFFKGGPIMWPLLLASIIALGTVFERMIFLLIEKSKNDPEAIKKFLDAVRQNDAEYAVQMSHTSDSYVMRTLTYALEHKEKSLSSALLYAQEQELKKFRRGIPVLDTVITLAPLLGLLGTVTGMMGSFSLIGGELSAPGAITGGIAEALIATAFGLGIAITALVPFNLINTQTEEARLAIEAAASQFKLALQPSVVMR